MALDAAQKKTILDEYGTHEGDTGSPEAQIALLTKRISDLTEHLKMHKHDHHWSGGAAACSSTCAWSTSRATAPSSSGSASAADPAGPAFHGAGPAPNCRRPRVGRTRRAGPR